MNSRDTTRKASGLVRLLNRITGQLCAILLLVAQTVSAASDQVIQMADGTKLTCLGLTTGKHHVAPGYENLRTGNPIYTRENETVAWILAEHDPAKWPSYELLVSDKANTACVNVEKQSSSHVKSGVDIQGFVLRAFPRWEKEFVLRARPYRGAIADGQFVVANPEQKPAADWRAESLPETKSDGDLEVTLTNLVSGVLRPYRLGGPPPEKDPANNGVHLQFGFRQNDHSVTNWRPWLVATSDATGNHVEGLLSVYPENGVFDYPRVNPLAFTKDGYFYHPGLWPSQSPWKVRLEFSQTSGFSDYETITFTNLPVRAGTQQEYDEEWTWNGNGGDFKLTPGIVNGINVKLAEILLVTNRWNPSQKEITAILYADGNPASDGMRLTLVEATDEEGRPVASAGGAPWAGHFSLDFPNVHEIKTLNLKLALHKSRFVEFTVNPAKR